MRRLTAIMFTDLVGYTKLMQADEQQARLNRDRSRQVLDAAVDAHRGQILQFYGDGALSVFDSAIEAVLSAIEIQHALSGEPRVPLRIGIHTGDVVHDNDGVFGDGVNVASRIEGLAIPGGIFISQKVYDEVKNQPGIATVSLGEFNLKNVQRPMEVFAIANEGVASPSREEILTRSPRLHRSIAVLPFANSSADPENEFFSDGITEELISALTRVNGLQVTARTSSFAFKGRQVDVRQVGRELGVTKVLEGSVRTFGDRVRIIVQLIDAANGYQIFSNSYDEELSQVFELQNRLAGEIVGQLEAELDGQTSERTVLEERTGNGQPSPPDTDAYKEYLRGLHEWNQWTDEGARQAIEHYRRSAELDPDCGLPYSSMAFAYAFLGSLGHLPSAEAFRQAESAANRAIELRDGLGPAYGALGAVRLFHDWRFLEAYDFIQKALTKNPGSADAHNLYSMYLRVIGELEEAVEEMEEAVALDPLSSFRKNVLGLTYLTAGRVNDARVCLERVLAVAPDFRAARENLGWTYVRHGDPEKALAILNGHTPGSGEEVKSLGLRGYLFGRLGLNGRAADIISGLNERKTEADDLSALLDLAMVHNGLGNRAEALEQLSQAIEGRVGWMVFLGTSPFFSELHDEPGFQELLGRIGLQPSQPS